MEVMPTVKFPRVGDVIEVLWEGPDGPQWYSGKLLKRQKKGAHRFLIAYEDGDEVDQDLNDDSWRFPSLLCPSLVAFEPGQLNDMWDEHKARNKRKAVGQEEQDQADDHKNKRKRTTRPVRNCNVAEWKKEELKKEEDREKKKRKKKKEQKASEEESCADDDALFERSLFDNMAVITVFVDEPVQEGKDVYHFDPHCTQQSSENTPVSVPEIDEQFISSSTCSTADSSMCTSSHDRFDGRDTHLPLRKRWKSQPTRE